MAFSFSQLQQMVYVETNRPDAVAQTTNALVSATMVLHGLEFFNKDLMESLVVFDAAGYIQQLDTSALPRFRSLNYIRKWDPAYAASQQNPTVLPPLVNSLGFGYTNPRLVLNTIKIITPDDLFDSYNTEKVDVAYQAGSVINIKSSTQVAQAAFGFYSWPAFDSANNYAGYNDWIANEFPFALVYYASSNCFAQFGDNDTANRYCKKNVDANGNTYWSGLAGDHINNLVRGNILANGW